LRPVLLNGQTLTKSWLTTKVQQQINKDTLVGLLLAPFYYFEIAFAPNLHTTPTPPLSSPNFEPTTLQYPNYGEISNQPLDITNPAIPVPFFQNNHPGPLVSFAIYHFVPVSQK
jgi:hypothetical protein